MTPSTIAAQVIVRGYLHGRAMDADFFEAAVWMAEKRCRDGIVPVLSESLRQDIDSQAGALKAIAQPWDRQSPYLNSWFAS